MSSAMPDYSTTGGLPLRRPAKNRREEEIDPLLTLPDLPASPKPWRGAPFLAALVCVAFLMLQLLPATHFRLPNDSTRTWIPFRNTSSSSAGLEISKENANAEDFIHAINSVPVNVFICTDEQDLRPVFVVINSTLSNTRHQQQIHFYILTTETRRQIWLAKLTSFFPGVNIHLVSTGVDLEALRAHISFRKDSKARETLTSPYNFLPFYLPRMFPDMPKLIYLDSDVVVKGDIQELFSTDLENYPVAAVEDCSQKFDSGYFNFDLVDRIQEREAGKLSWIPSEPFVRETCVFNRGVLVINPQRWLEQNITEAIEWWMDESLGAEKTLYRYGVSQPPFLLSLYRNYKKLDISWNTRGLGRNEFSQSEREYMKKLYLRRPARRPFLSPNTDHSKILHFNGKFKPWNRDRHLKPGDQPVSLCGSKSEDCAQLWWSYISPFVSNLLRLD